MRLECIKLIGFKSFVDTTIVHFPSNMCGVVGPNGCGKSNIIDAVRWVMGESSAKSLRGESMTDVIFKGSKTRKPAGYAQVELMFSNHEGRVTGEYASYSEISIKRHLTSDAQSTYFLNGTKCRRRDVMDIFFGTGLGPRSYSIISQGMISNLIESKPEELRIFIEEAAGVSKYKERRRETENRLKRTMDNLLRLNDLREEIERRLALLERQAKAAEKYKRYQEEVRIKRAELCGLRWRALSETLQQQEQGVGECEIMMEAAISKQLSGEGEMEQRRQEYQEYNDLFQQKQSDYYKMGNEITRFEQILEYRKEKQEQLTLDLSESETLIVENQKQIIADEKALNVMEENKEAVTVKLACFSEQENEEKQRVLDAEIMMQSWQKRWDDFITEGQQSMS